MRGARGDFLESMGQQFLNYAGGAPKLYINRLGLLPDTHALKSRITAAPRLFLGQSVQRFLNSPTQIQNHCTLEGISRENVAAILKLTP